MTAISDTWALTVRDLLRLWRQPWFIAIVLVQPVIWLLLFGELFQRVVEIPGFEGGDYKQYLVPGVLVMTAFFSSGWNGMSTIEDLERGVTDRLLVTPARRWPLIVGRLGQNAVQVLIQSLVIIGMALAIGVSFEGGVLGVIALVLAGLLLGTAFAALSNALALVARQEESLIPNWVATAADYNPVNWAIVAGREAVQSGTDWGTVAGYCGLLAAFALACTMLATRAFRAYQSSV
jgi:ABC-2 type transport system permease protein